MSIYYEIKSFDTTKNIPRRKLISGIDFRTLRTKNDTGVSFVRDVRKNDTGVSIVAIFEYQLKIIPIGKTSAYMKPVYAIFFLIFVPTFSFVFSVSIADIGYVI